MIGQTISHYRIVANLGGGGMGVVCIAEDLRLGRRVAVKFIRGSASKSPTALSRLKREAQALSSLNHPNICTVYEIEEHEGQTFIVMELLEGESLAERMHGKPLATEDVLELGIQVAGALDDTHIKGIVHRDIKPGNIFLTKRGLWKVLDFGIAKLTTERPLKHPIDPEARDYEALDASDQETLTVEGAIMGTWFYMSPEQARGEQLDGRTDIFSLGVVLYEMATGKKPFIGNRACDTMDAILTQQPVSPLKHNPDLPPRFEAILAKAMEKDREFRYQSAYEIRIDLQRLKRETESGHSAAASSGTVAVHESPVAVRKFWKILVPVGALVVVLALAAAFWLGRGGRGSAGTAAPGTPSIAVLPFADLSREKDQEYFSDGLSEELLNDLAKIPGLRVAARTSSFQFKGKTEDLRTVGEKLNVATILEGSVRKEGSRVRVTAQLIKVADGFHLWSETYDRQLNDIFAVQDEIARSVAGSLKVKLLGEKTATPSRGTNVEAYNAYLQGRYFYGRRSKENLEKAIDYYEQAIKLDPDYAPAWAGLAAARSFQADSTYLPVEEGYRKARAAAERALALDANLAEAHEAMAWIQRSYDWDWGGADASFQRALALEPGNAVAIRGAARLAATLGRFEEAMALDRRALELDPLSVSTSGHLGFAAYYAGRLDEAIAAYKKALELNPEGVFTHTSLGRVYLAQAHPQEALAEMEREPEPDLRLQGQALAYHALGRKMESDAALAEYGAKYHAEGAYQIAEVYAFRGEADRAFEWLERAYAQRDGGLADMKGDPLLKNLERDPRYAAFLKKMRLPA